MTKMLRPSAVAEILDVSERTVLDWLGQGIIRGRKLGKFWRVHPNEIERLMSDGADNVIPLRRTK